MVAHDLLNLAISSDEQAELASAVGASLRTVQNWTRGGTTPRGTTATRLLDVQHIVNELREVYVVGGM